MIIVLPFLPIPTLHTLHGGSGSKLLYTSQKRNKGGSKKMKTQRIREKIKEYLKEYGPKSTLEILDMINDTYRNGTTCQQLGNVLSKDRDIIKTGHVKVLSNFTGTYNICEWGLKEDLFM